MDIQNVMTIAEATRLWGLGDSTIRKAIERGRFSKEECRKSKGTWLLTRSGIERLFGELKKK